MNCGVMILDRRKVNVNHTLFFFLYKNHIWMIIYGVFLCLSKNKNGKRPCSTLCVIINAFLFINMYVVA